VTHAAAVSAALRRSGFNPYGSASRRSRAGLRVTNSSAGRVLVCADLDAPYATQALAIDARSALYVAGYAVTAITDGAFYASRP
jgi:hypothetical protein